jgi:bidirectional [NiFe] hydrogenase diaphorase subunit
MPTPSESIPKKNFKSVDMTIKRHQASADALIEVLHKAQESQGFLDSEVLNHVARGLKLPPSQVYGVATFYHLFTLKPNATHSCVVCLGTACYVKGSSKIMQALQNELGVQMGETTPDGQISLLSARCIGACGIAPVLVVDDVVQGKQTIQTALASLQKLAQPTQ